MLELWNDGFKEKIKAHNFAMIFLVLMGYFSG
jgi:hypothetical protein